MKRALLVAVLVAVAGCRHAPRALHRVIVDDTPEGRQCYADAMETYEGCKWHRGRNGLCARLRYEALMACPGAKDVTGQPDPTVIQLPGYRP